MWQSGYYLQSVRYYRWLNNAIIQWRFTQKPTNRPLALKGWFEKPKNRLFGHVRVNNLRRRHNMYDVSACDVALQNNLAPSLCVMKNIHDVTSSVIVVFKATRPFSLPEWCSVNKNGCTTLDSCIPSGTKWCYSTIWVMFSNYLMYIVSTIS
jgi:hypothetical protein